ncbi:uncharacterized protein FSUBG_9453 [Fusarium subglutinans]|uniref:Uncharacterized protein n=1 Tax=Gibberella subglutinans TaxID=42677 RepID=A0A8H5PDA5_GIBSU|nr:uncharacterized protein FSUBG_9453 [Fusarium subglutinans]KAF5594351.1 hypothetical protein FSUBG_9453 [Fusarium subglutinans]
MTSQEEQSHKRKSDATHTSEAPIFTPIHRKQAMVDHSPRSLSRYCSKTDGGDDEDEATWKRQTDAPAPSLEDRRVDLATAPTTNSTLPGFACVGCGSSSHRLNLCMQASSSSGLMKGYPWCNTLNHSLTNCPGTKHDLALQLEFIQMRANMPSFQPTLDWVDVVRAAIADGHKPPTSFPWTAHFTKKISKAVEAFQQDLDKVGINRRVGLPIDPWTKDWETVQRNFP